MLTAGAALTLAEELTMKLPLTALSPAPTCIQTAAAAMGAEARDCCYGGRPDKLIDLRTRPGNASLPRSASVVNDWRLLAPAVGAPLMNCRRSHGLLNSLPLPR